MNTVYAFKNLTLLCLTLLKTKNPEEPSSSGFQILIRSQA